MTAKSGDTVRIHYTGTLTDGTTFDSSRGRDPLEFRLGEAQVIPGLEKAIEGMAVGDTKLVQIPQDQAYGPRNPEALQTVDRAMVPDHIPTEPGTRLEVQTADGQRMPVVVSDVNEQTLTLDANHPLAGQDLTFDVELVEIAQAA